MSRPSPSNPDDLNWVEFHPLRAANGSRTELTARPAENTHKALAIAEGLEYGLTLGLGAIDPRAVVAASHGFSNRDIDSILDCPNQPVPNGSATCPGGSDSVADLAIVLAYDLGDLAPGQSVSFDYAYILSADDLETALGSLAAVSILQPTGSVSGSSVIYQATTDDVEHTDKISFYVDGILVGEDTTADAGGVFETGFDSLPFANGAHTLKVVALFEDGRTVEKTGSITVDNAGPSMAFVTPENGDYFNGDGIAVLIGSINPEQPPVRVSFFRESVTGGSLFLGEDTAEPFESFFGVTDLPEGETVVIKAVGTDAAGRTTTVTVSGSVLSSNSAPVAVCQDVVVEAEAMCQASADVNNGSYDPDGDELSLEQSPAGPYPLGINSVTLHVSDSSLSDSCSAVVEVVDTTAPAITAPADLTVEATAVETAVALGMPTAEDACGILSVSNDAPAAFAIGSTTVIWTVVDSNHNMGTASQSVTVQDTTAPVLTLPANMTVEATGALTTVDIGMATAEDIFPVTVTNDAPAAFPAGTTNVTWRAVDANGNSATGVQTITVVDTTPPENLECNAQNIFPKEVPVSFTATATDAVSEPVVTVTGYSCSMYNGSGQLVDKTGDCAVTYENSTVSIHETAGVGSYIGWSFTAVDASGNERTGSCMIQVLNPGKRASENGKDHSEKKGM